MNKVMKEMISTLLYLLAVLCLTWAVIHFVGQRTEVEGASMESTLSDGDNLIVDKISYRFRNPLRFDIIVFPFRYKENTYYIKRIIGLPGETVQIDEQGNIYITVKSFRRVTAEKSLSRKISDWRQNLLHLEKMNILLWETTEITVLTAGQRLWVIFTAMRLSGVHG